jgi:prenyltransferase beta subunit
LAGQQLPNGAFGSYSGSQTPDLFNTAQNLLILSNIGNAISVEPDVINTTAEYLLNLTLQDGSFRILPPIE